MERDDLVLAMAPPGATDVAHDNGKAAARDERAHALSPDSVQLVEEALIVMEMAELGGPILVFNEVEIRRGGDDKVNGLVLDGLHAPRIAQDDAVCGLEMVMLDELTVDTELFLDGRLTAVQILDQLERLAHVPSGRGV